MNHSDFIVGGTFWSDDRQWQCTDIGRRVIVALRIDTVELGGSNPSMHRTLNREQAEAEGLFNGPPYMGPEVVFDEYDIEGCTPDPSAVDRAEIPAELPDGREQARALRAQASEGGLRFHAYLPSSLADWLLELVERGVFSDPSEAVFVMMGEFQELWPHQDLRDELLRRSVQAAIDDPRRGISGEEVAARMKLWSELPRPEPAQWRKLRS